MWVELEMLPIILKTKSCEAIYFVSYEKKNPLPITFLILQSYHFFHPPILSPLPILSSSHPFSPILPSYCRPQSSHPLTLIIPWYHPHPPILSLFLSPQSIDPPPHPPILSPPILPSSHPITTYPSILPSYRCESDIKIEIEIEIMFTRS